jgi:F-type H+-transporting ATPase subunit b
MSLNYSVFFIMGLVLILMLLFDRYLFTPLSSILSRRKELIAETRVKRDEAFARVEELLRPYREEIDLVVREGEAIKAAFRKEGEWMKEEILERARERGEEMVAQVERELKEEVVRARSELNAEGEELSDRLASVILGIRPD